MEENNLFDIIDAQVMKDAKKEEIIVVANLAKNVFELDWKEMTNNERSCNAVGGSSNVTKSS